MLRSLESVMEAVFGLVLSDVPDQGLAQNPNGMPAKVIQKLLRKGIEELVKYFAQGNRWTGGQTVNSRKRLAALTLVFALVLVALAGRSPVLVLAPTPELTGTTWTGKERLPGFNQLSFKFNAQGDVRMINPKKTVRETAHGTWTQQGDTIEIRIAGCVYRGRVNGRTIEGNAEFTCGDYAEWTWQVQQK